MKNIPSFITRHRPLYSLGAAFTLAISLTACGGGSASDPIATAAPTNIPTNIIQAPTPTPAVATLTTQSLAEVPSPTVVGPTPTPTPVATLTVQSLATVPSPTDQEPTPTPSPAKEDTMTATGGLSMGGAALGGSAETTLLAQEILLGVPEGRLAWVAHESNLAAGQTLEHVHEFAFVYAKDGPHRFQVGQNDRDLTSGEGAVVAAGEPHRHLAPDGPSVFWEVRLTAPGSAPAPNLPNSTLVFDSGLLREIPASPMATFVLVRVPVDGETSVHTHPGPELIYQLSGKIDYQNALIGTKLMGPGKIEGIPPGVSVQKRNPYPEDAEFLSWFLVDASQPFASAAAFERSRALGDNLASSGQGARIVGVSSNYGGGANDSSFGADKALDGNPTTAWSSNGDGNDAWFEIELPSETRVTSLGFWSRTMGDSAEILSFRVVTDRGDIVGPFTLKGSDRIYYFETDITGKKLRFEAVDTSGGNTGAMEIEVYGAPLP